MALAYSEVVREAGAQRTLKVREHRNVEQHELDAKLG